MKKKKACDLLTEMNSWKWKTNTLTTICERTTEAHYTLVQWIGSDFCLPSLHVSTLYTIKSMKMRTSKIQSPPHPEKQKQNKQTHKQKRLLYREEAVSVFVVVVVVFSCSAIKYGLWPLVLVITWLRKYQVLLPLIFEWTSRVIAYYMIHCKYQRYILTRCSVNLLVVFNTMVLKRVFFVIINTCVALIWALMC